MQQKWDETELCQAHYYLDEAAYELSRTSFMAEMAYNQEKGWMLYVGSGFVKLTVAVIAETPGDAEQVFEHWCRKNNRLGEIGEGPNEPEESWGEYECSWERIPTPVIMMPAEIGE